MSAPLCLTSLPFPFLMYPPLSLFSYVSIVIVGVLKDSDYSLAPDNFHVRSAAVDWFALNLKRPLQMALQEIMTSVARVWRQNCGCSSQLSCFCCGSDARCLGCSPPSGLVFKKQFVYAIEWSVRTWARLSWLGTHYQWRRCTDKLFLRTKSFANSAPDSIYIFFSMNFEQKAAKEALTRASWVDLQLGNTRTPSRARRGHKEDS